MKILILGGGPAGLGAAWRLNELGYSDWQLLEANDYAGGLASSFRDKQGFFWDIGGHVQFSHYDYFDALMHKLIPKEYSPAAAGRDRSLSERAGRNSEERLAQTH